MTVQSNYTEEEAVGESLLPVLVDPSNKKFCAISRRDVISFDVDSGKRLKLYKHSEKVIGIHWFQKNMISITSGGKITMWELESGEEIGSSSVTASCQFQWTYETEGSIFVLGKISGSSHQEDDSNSSSSFGSSSSVLLQLIGFNESGQKSQSVSVQKILEFEEAIQEKRYLAVAKDLVALCNGKEVKIILFEHSTKVNGPTSFTLRTKFDTVQDNGLIVFDGVQLSEDSLFASLSFGRIYFWSRIREGGLGHTNKSFINVTGCHVEFAVSDRKTIYTGDGECTLAKWNLATSGTGRWYRAEYFDVESPIESVHLSQDASLLVCSLSDNSVYVVKTATMTIISQAQVMNISTTPSLQWMGWNLDPAQPEYLVTNARIGHIQWIDPVKWKTIALFDVSEENPPSKDHFNSPNTLWLNPYLISLSVSRFVTCEMRRNFSDTSYVKIFKRMKRGSMADFKLEDCTVIHRKVSFVRSSLDEVLNPTENEVSEEEFLLIDAHGEIDVLTSDAFRNGKWANSEKRREISWQRSNIRDCSRIRAGLFATINFLYGQNFVLIWRLSDLKILTHIDSLRDSNQVQWAPRNEMNNVIAPTPILIIAADSVIGAYNLESKSFVWKMTHNSNFSIFSSSFSCIAYDSIQVIHFDAATGRELNVQKFSEPQQCVVFSGFPSNIRFTGISDQGLRTIKQDTPENDVFCDIAVEKKRTPFSELLMKKPLPNENYAEKYTAKFVELQSVPSTKKFFDGPAHSLAPLTIIAPLFIRNCLVKKKPV